MYPKSLRHKSRVNRQIVLNIPAATYVGCVELIENIENAACVTVDLESCYKNYAHYGSFLYTYIFNPYSRYVPSYIFLK